MRLFHLLVGFVTAAGLAACGSKSAHKIIDADTTDSPPDAFECVFKNPGSFNPSAPLDFTGGMGQSMGKVPGGTKTQLQTGANVTFQDANMQADGTGFGIFMVNRGGVFSDTEAGIFEKPPTPGTYAMDEDDKAGFGIDFFDGVSPTSIDPKQVYLLDSTMNTPTVTIDTFTPAAAPGAHTKVGATTKTATFVGFTVDGDSLTQNDCLISIVNFQFTNLDVLWQTEPFPTSLAPAAASPGLPPGITKTADGKYHFNREAWHAHHDHLRTATMQH